MIIEYHLIAQGKCHIHFMNVNLIWRATFSEQFGVCDHECITYMPPSNIKYSGQVGVVS